MRLIPPTPPQPADFPCPGLFGPLIVHDGSDDPGRAEPNPRPRYRVNDLPIPKHGGMGSVYHVYDRQMRMPQALKTIRRLYRSDPATIDLFWREARVLPWLNHPNMCRVYDAGTHDEHHYLTMFYIEGEPLGGDHAPDPRAAAAIIRDVALAVSHLHERGFIHRDLKAGNILIDGQGRPIVIDFGLVLNVSDTSSRGASDPTVGTPSYMAPEQARGEILTLGPWSDVFSLGIVMYELMAGIRPFPGRPGEAMAAIADHHVHAAPPTKHVPGLDAELVEACMKAIAKDRRVRYPSMEAFAADLTAYLNAPATPAPAGWLARLLHKAPVVPVPPGVPAPRPGTGRVASDRVRFSFAGHGEVAPPDLVGQDMLYLDVGHDLRAGVIDHHHGGTQGSACAAVLAHPDLVRSALRPYRADDDSFVIVLHREPDLDAVASAYLATAILRDGTAPPGAKMLADYVDAIDRGESGLSLGQPYTAYAALMQVGHRLALMNWTSPAECWTELVTTGMTVLEYALREAARLGKPLAEVDAFGCPGLFRKLDRVEVTSDIDRYNAKLADPQTHARTAALRLPTPDGEAAEVDALLVRNVQDATDPDRCIFFKDWARTDRERAPGSGGFVALCVIEAGGVPGTMRGILSVRPDSGVTLDGLGAAMEKAEAAKREERFGDDDRWFDKAGRQLPVRDGYNNPDPWYDGRGNDFTIIDAPRAGSALSADEIEAVFLKFGGAGPSR